MRQAPQHVCRYLLLFSSSYSTFIIIIMIATFHYQRLKLKIIQVGNYASQYGSFFNDLVSSSDYYAQVIQFAYKDPELVQAHRLCAILSLYNIMFLLLIIGLCCYVLPSVLMAVIDLLAACMLLVLDTYNVPD